MNVAILIVGLLLFVLGGILGIFIKEIYEKLNTMFGALIDVEKALYKVASILEYGFVKKGKKDE